MASLAKCTSTCTCAPYADKSVESHDTNALFDTLFFFIVWNHKYQHNSMHVYSSVSAIESKGTSSQDIMHRLATLVLVVVILEVSWSSARLIVCTIVACDAGGEMVFVWEREGTRMTAFSQTGLEV